MRLQKHALLPVIARIEEGKESFTRSPEAYGEVPVLSVLTSTLAIDAEETEFRIL